MKKKLNLKAGSRTSEETVLLKAFKFFDLTNSGKCFKKDFLKVVNKIGIYMKEDQLSELFEIYDTDQNGYLDYKEFVGILYGNKSIRSSFKKPKEIVTHYGMDTGRGHERAQTEYRSQKARNANFKQEFLDDDEVKEILETIRKKLASRGVRGICSIGRNFR